MGNMTVLEPFGHYHTSISELNDMASDALAGRDRATNKSLAAIFFRKLSTSMVQDRRVWRVVLPAFDNMARLAVDSDTRLGRQRKMLELSSSRIIAMLSPGANHPLPYDPQASALITLGNHAPGSEDRRTAGRMLSALVGNSNTIDSEFSVRGAVLAVKLAGNHQEMREAVAATKHAFACSTQPAHVARGALDVLSVASLPPQEIYWMKNNFTRAVSQLDPTTARPLLARAAEVTDRLVVTMPKPVAAAPGSHRPARRADILPISASPRYLRVPGIFF